MTTTKPLIAVILGNLGSPEAPTPQAVSRYLGQFLSDQRVVDVPKWKWAPILRLIRYKRSPRVAKVYQGVWTPEGSPLIVLQRRLAAKVHQALSERFPEFEFLVESAMSYQTPSITTVASELFARRPAKFILVPMYPQYSSSTTLSVIDAFNRSYEHKNVRYTPAFDIVHHYHHRPEYIQRIANSIIDHVQERTLAQGGVAQTPAQYFSAQHKLFLSFHGVPTRFVAELEDPYQQHCEETVALVAQQLGLQPEQYQICYQSKFGKEPWILPATDESLAAHATQAQAQATVICPGFTIDCIETLEEIEIENRQHFLEHGGQAFHYIPCLNDSEQHAQLMVDLIAPRLTWL